MYDLKHWKHGINITVGEFCEYLRENVPVAATVHVCGDSRIFLHLSRDGKAFSIDHDPLSDLPEYDGREPVEMDSGEEGGI